MIKLLFILFLNSFKFFLCDYIAAVVEHSVYMGNENDSSSNLLDINIQLYENLTTLAKLNSAQVIVFPEFGLTPTKGESRSDLYPYLEVIPDVNPTQLISPCLTPEKFSNSPILLRMSCAAKNNKILTLINIIDKQDCSSTTDSNCPSDGHYQYNTDVLFDENGYIVAKYHKSHEWPPFKVAYDEPLTPSHVTYLSSFGVEFGLFICFDIMFEDPPKVLRQNGISHFLYAVAQGDAGKNTIIEPWSEHNSAVVLASNLGAGPKKDCSEIIVNGVGVSSKKYYLQNKQFKDENVLIGRVPS